MSEPRNGPVPDSATVVEFIHVAERREELERELAVLRRREAALTDDLLSWMEDHQLSRFVSHGRVFRERIGRSHPKWKAAVIRQCGRQFAEQLQRQSPRSVTLAMTTDVPTASATQLVRRGRR